MRCPSSSQLFWHRHGELSARERRTIERHLASCPACRKQYGQATQMAMGLARNLNQPGSASRAFPLPTLPKGRSWVGLACLAAIVVALLRLHGEVTAPTAWASSPHRWTQADVCSRLKVSAAAPYPGKGPVAAKPTPYPAAPYAAFCLPSQEKECP